MLKALVSFFKTVLRDCIRCLRLSVVFQSVFNFFGMLVQIVGSFRLFRCFKQIWVAQLVSGCSRWKT